MKGKKKIGNTDYIKKGVYESNPSGVFQKENLLRGKEYMRKIKDFFVMFKFFITTWYKSKYFFMYGGNDLKTMNKIKKALDKNTKTTWNI